MNTEENETNTNVETEVTIKELKADIYIKNLETISHLHEKVAEMADLWKKDREAFFNHLASWFESNLGASELSIIYNDLKMPENEDGKPELIKSLMTKNNEDEWKKSEPEQSHIDLFNEYQDSIKLAPRCLEIGEDTLTFGGSLTQSPFLLVCRYKTCGALQQALLKGIFSGLHHNLTL